MERYGDASGVARMGLGTAQAVMEANASRYHGKAPNELDWTDAQRQTRTVAEYLAGLDAETKPQTEGGEDSGGGGSYGEPPPGPIASRRK